VLMRRKRTTTDFFINPPFAWDKPKTGKNYSNKKKNWRVLIIS
jgi:hypothetical protein